MTDLNEFQIFYRMYMPMMKATYAAAGVITFMNAWNSYLWPKVMMTMPEAQTMPMLIANMSGGYTTDYGMLMVGVLVLFCTDDGCILRPAETVRRRYYRCCKIRRIRDPGKGKERAAACAAALCMWRKPRAGLEEVLRPRVSSAAGIQPG